MCVRAQSCLTLCDPMDCSPPGSSVHGIFQARILEWVAPPLGDLAHSETKPASPATPALQADSLLLSHHESPNNMSKLEKLEDTVVWNNTLSQFLFGWCMGMTQRDVVGREVGGGFMFGNACKN